MFLIGRQVCHQKREKGLSKLCSIGQDLQVLA